MHVAVIGSGAWGTTLSGLAHEAGSEVTLVARSRSVFEALKHERRHPTSLQGYELPAEIGIVQEAEAALDMNPDILIAAVPSSSVDEVSGLLATNSWRGPIVSATKGLGPQRFMTPSERLAADLGGTSRIAVLSGPNLAREIAAGLPAAAVIASEQESVAEAARNALMSSRFRVYTSHDVIGIEIAGAVKNVMAIGAGIADGLNAGQNAKAAYMTRGIAEMARLGVACGANPMTFAGLAGIGDLMATCNSENSRNHTVGRGLAQGRAIEEILAELHEVAEGVPTTRAALALGKVKGVELPITARVARVMFECISPSDAIAELMARDATGELSL